MGRLRDVWHAGGAYFGLGVNTGEGEGCKLEDRGDEASQERLDGGPANGDEGEIDLDGAKEENERICLRKEMTLCI